MPASTKSRPLAPIQRKIAMPPKVTARPRVYPLDTMLPGDMIFVPLDTTRRTPLSTYVSKVGGELGRKFSTRQMQMLWRKDRWIPVPKSYRGTKAVTGTGVWRIK